MSLIKAAWIIMALLGIGKFLLDYSRMRKEKKAIGSVIEKWSLRLNLRIRGNWIAFLFVLIYLATSAYFVVKSPQSNSTFFLAAVFILVMGFYYFRWQFIYGKQGFIYKTKVIPNERIVKKDIVFTNGERHLLILYAENSPGKETHELMIPIPRKTLV